MILLIGGAAETEPIAKKLADTGASILVSKATSVPLSIPAHPLIEVRSGRLTVEETVALIGERNINCIIHAAHPYATAAQHMSHKAAQITEKPWLLFLRPPAANKCKGVHRVKNHEEAAKKAFSFAKGVLLTTGSVNLLPYSRKAKEMRLPLFARILDVNESRQKCLEAGILPERILTGRGPFTVEENIADIRRVGAGVLVTKDGGEKGGVLEKIEAAQFLGCSIILIERETPPVKYYFEDIDKLCAEALQIQTEQYP